MPEPAPEFIGGFADASGINLNAAREYWRGYSRGLSATEIDEIEGGGRAAGQAQAMRWLAGFAARTENDARPPSAHGNREAHF